MARRKIKRKTSPWKPCMTVGRKFATRRHLLLANGMAKRMSRLKTKRIVRGLSTTAVAQKRNLILGFPAEIRILIYTFAVVEKEDMWSLGTPELSQVSRQLREEVLPIYYSKNSFELCLSPSSWWDGMPSPPAVIKATAKYYYESFKPLCKSLVPFISHITSLWVFLVDKDKFEIGFLFQPAAHHSGIKIGHGCKNWSDRTVIMKTFRAAMRKHKVGRVYNNEIAEEYLDILVIVSALRFFKKHCAAAHNTRLLWV
ncbi:hypothetical protein EV127DRAFT_68508 [Xylaria flabelliformis]|nr:hypothetical protein EV127DRAFT_68508 [Xylaria flabelliformis]